MSAASPWIDVLCTSFLLEELFHLLFWRLLYLLHLPLNRGLPDWDLVLLPQESRTTISLLPHAGQVVPPGDSVMQPPSPSRQCRRVGLALRPALTFSPRALFMATCKKAPFLSESSYATKFHPQNSPGLLPLLLIGVVRLMTRTVIEFCSPLLMIPPDSQRKVTHWKMNVRVERSSNGAFVCQEFLSEYCTAYYKIMPCFFVIKSS